MGTKPRSKPLRLAEKLATIRQRLGVSLSEMTRLLEVRVSSSRLCEYEHGTREPNLLILLSYGRLIGISVDVLIDDDQNLRSEINVKVRKKR